jgi:hypothetical protein
MIERLTKETELETEEDMSKKPIIDEQYLSDLEDCAGVSSEIDSRQLAYTFTVEGLQTTTLTPTETHNMALAGKGTRFGPAAHVRFAILSFNDWLYKNPSPTLFN